MTVLVALSVVTIYGTSDTLKELEKQEKLAEQRQKDLAAQRKAQEATLNEIRDAFKDIQSELAESDQNIKDIFASIEALEIEISNMNLTIDELENQLETKRNEITRVKLELQEIRFQKDDLRDMAAERIRVMYEYGDAGFLEVLFDSKDIMDMFSRLEYINRLVEADNNLFFELDDMEGEILRREAELEIHEATITHLTNEAEFERSQLENRATSKNLEIERAKEIFDLQQKEQSTLEEEEEQAESQLDAIEKEEAKVDREMEAVLKLKAAEINRLNGYTYSGGQMLWPTPGWYRISSKFGPRLHPIKKTWRNHNGLDIAAGGGADIIAAETGEVVLSQYSSSYGYYMIVYHGEGYSTLYAHCSKLLFKVGDEVLAGQTIAKVGSTGWSTGNHLHFGVKKDGVWLDPINFVQ